MSETTLEQEEIRESHAVVDMVGDVRAFNSKFNIPMAEDGPHELSTAQKKFRANFLLEELYEYFQAIGIFTDTVAGSQGCFDAPYVYAYEPDTPKGKARDVKALDALVDLVYVALGTAHIHGFNFSEAWKRVHEANMKKVLAKDCPEFVQDKAWRDKSPMDIVKPEGWLPPSLEDLV